MRGCLLDNNVINFDENDKNKGGVGMSWCCIIEKPIDDKYSPKKSPLFIDKLHQFRTSMYSNLDIFIR